MSVVFFSNLLVRAKTFSLATVLGARPGYFKINLMIYILLKYGISGVVLNISASWEQRGWVLVGDTTVLWVGVESYLSWR